VEAFNHGELGVDRCEAVGVNVAAMIENVAVTLRLQANGHVLESPPSQIQASVTFCVAEKRTMKRRDFLMAGATGGAILRTRIFLLYADGFSKEMDINSASPDQLAPLPFHGMSPYPYRWPEHHRLDAKHRKYFEEYNTRIIMGQITRVETISGK
jgi:hypothetical protein